MFAGLLVLWVIDGRTKKEQVLHTLFSVGVVWMVTLIIKDLYPISRPFMALPGMTPMTVTIPVDASFPSTHTAVVFALGTTVFMHDKRVGFYFFMGAVLVAIGRILANVHYPSDIIAGALIGVLISWLGAKVHLFRFLSGS